MLLACPLLLLLWEYPMTSKMFPNSRQFSKSSGFGDVISYFKGFSQSSKCQQWLNVDPNTPANIAKSSKIHTKN